MMHSRDQFGNCPLLLYNSSAESKFPQYVTAYRLFGGDVITTMTTEIFIILLLYIYIHKTAFI